MGTLNKDRQAAFKQRMRDAGLRQATYWVNPDQEVRIKTLLGNAAPAEPTPVASAASLAAERAALVVQGQHLEERAVALDQREQALARRERRAQSKSDQARGVAPHIDTTKRIAQLVAQFTTTRNAATGKAEQIDEGWRAADRAKALATLARETALARTIITKLLASWRTGGLLADAEIDQLTQAAAVLGWLGQAATEAKPRVTSNAKAVEAKDAARTQVARQAVASAFASPAIEDLVLWAYALRMAHDYYFTKLATMRPDNFAPDDLSYHVRNLEEEVTRSLEEEAKKLIKSGKTPAAAIAELRAFLTAAQPKLATEHPGMIDRLRACQVAAELTRANGKAGQGTHAR